MPCINSKLQGSSRDHPQKQILFQLPKRKQPLPALLFSSCAFCPCTLEGFKKFPVSGCFSGSHQIPGVRPIESVEPHQHRQRLHVGGRAARHRVVGGVGQVVHAAGEAEVRVPAAMSHPQGGLEMPCRLGLAFKRFKR